MALGGAFEMRGLSGDGGTLTYQNSKRGCATSDPAGRAFHIC